MSYIFWKLLVQRLILAINQVFLSILQGVRILLTHCNRIVHKIWHHVSSVIQFLLVLYFEACTLYIFDQRLYWTQIIWVFSVLDNRLLADNLSQLPKVSIWLRKGWEEVFVYLKVSFFTQIWHRQMRFDSSIYALLSQNGICRKYALFWSPFLLRSDSDVWVMSESNLIYLSQIWVKKETKKARIYDISHFATKVLRCSESNLICLSQIWVKSTSNLSKKNFFSSFS